jgi:hypothetical protein
VSLVTLARAEKGWKEDAMGESCDADVVFWVTKGSLSADGPWQAKALTGKRMGASPESRTFAGFVRRDDLVEPSSGEKAVRRVSGVPLGDSAGPLEERGDAGSYVSEAECSMASVEVNCRQKRAGSNARR